MPDENVICTGCGRLGPAPGPPYLSCCPERNPVPVNSAKGIETVRVFAEDRAEEKWNAEADRFNQWPALGQDERDKLIAVEMS